MRILLLCSAFNGLSQRAWLELRASGHDVVVQPADDDDVVRSVVAAVDPDLVICPFLRTRIPTEVCDSYPTVVIHPGPKGDRGPSALDWAIMEAEPVWGVTAVTAVEEFDAGPIWGSRTFPLGEDAPRKSALYNGAVTDAAVALIHEVVAYRRAELVEMSDDIFGDRNGFAAARSSFVGKGVAPTSSPRRQGEPRPRFAPAGGGGVAAPAGIR